jgi:hypothetical protein
MFGGPSAQETSTLQSQTQLANALWSNFNQQYQQQQGVLSQLQAQIGRIQSGQTGPGFSGAENAARIALIQNTTAAEARNAVQAARSVGAGTQVSPSGGMTRQSGINQQVGAQIASKIGAAGSNALLAEQAENFATGRENAYRTAGALQALSGDYNPAAYSGQENAALGQRFSMADKINQENIQRSQAIFGAATKLAMGAATFGAGGIGALGAGESFGEGASDFLSGGANAAFGTNFGINS